MRRVRLALLGLALAVALPVGILLARALQAAEAERQIRHDAVAGRAFDEMERVLTAWLEREEARPFDAYGFYRGEGAARIRTPLSQEPSEPFVVGAFQVDPDGTVHTPLRPRDEAFARERGDWPPDADIERRVDRVLALARALPERPRRRRAAVEVAKADEEAPDAAGGVSFGVLMAPPEQQADRAVPSALSRSPAPLEKEAPEPKGGRERASAYEVLDSLNRAASLRAERRQKVTRAPRAAVEAERGVSFPQSAHAPADRARAPRSEPAGAATGAADARRERSPAEAPSSPKREDDDATVRIALDPMIGVPLGDRDTADTMALYRTVVVGEQGFRQGLVIDLSELGRYLDDQILRTGRLAGRAAATFGPPGLPGARPSSSDYSFVHRFGEPFDALAVRLDLAALEGAGDDRPLYALLVLMVVLTGAGLFAVDRLTGVAVEYAERRSNFVAAVSHELKTPLTSIRMYGEMLRDGLVPDESKRAEYYGTITDESERLSRLIDNVLEFSRLEKGGRELSLVAGDVTDVVREAAERLAPHADRAGFSLRVEAPDDLPPVTFDRDALLQVLFNLVDNAIKYAAGAARREIVLSVARDGAGVALSVRDFGPGVPSGRLERIFEPFYRGESELTRRARGTGIGLALVRELTSAMGARVEGDAPEGGGFRVRLTFGPA
jgi:signal transduction histidine kinase